MSSILNTFDREHLSIFEVRIKAIVASHFGVFGQGWQTEEDLLASIGTKSPKAVSLIQDCIAAYTLVVQATEEGAETGIVDALAAKAIESSKAVAAEVEAVNSHTKNK